MLTSIILQITVIAIILFILVNYFIIAKHDKDIIDNIILARENEEEVDENEIYEMERVKARYLNDKFKVYLSRSIFFGVVFYCSMLYLVPPSPRQPSFISPPICSTNIVNSPPSIQLPVRSFFDATPW